MRLNLQAIPHSAASPLHAAQHLGEMPLPPLREEVARRPGFLRLR